MSFNELSESLNVRIEIISAERPLSTLRHIKEGLNFANEAHSKC